MDNIEKRMMLVTSYRRQKIVKILSKYGMEYHEYVLLRSLKMSDGLTLKEIKNIIGEKHRWIEDIVKDCIDRQLVCEKDQKLYLTAESKRAYSQIHKEIITMEDGIIKKMGNEHYYDLLNDLDILIDIYEED